MSIERTAEIVQAYLGEEGLDRVAEDAVYTVMGTGEEIRGREAIGQFLDSLYQQGFQARAASISQVVGENSAAFEYVFEGRHVGEVGPTLARALGLPKDTSATDSEVTVPFCVVYTVDDERITRAHIYFELGSLRRQLGL